MLKTKIKEMVKYNSLKYIAVLCLLFGFIFTWQQAFAWENGWAYICSDKACSKVPPHSDFKWILTISNPEYPENFYFAIDNNPRIQLQESKTVLVYVGDSGPTTYTGSFNPTSKNPMKNFKLYFGADIKAKMGLQVGLLAMVVGVRFSPIHFMLVPIPGGVPH